MYVIYRDTQNQYRWRYVARNGRIIAVSSEAYHNRQDCLAAINIMRGSGNDPVIDG